MKSCVFSRRCLSVFLSLFLVLGTASCANQEKSQEVLTQKVVQDGKTRLTVLVKYAFSINGFEEAVEKKFPSIDLVQVGNYTGNMGLTEYERRLEHDDLPDIVMTWPLDVGEEYWEDRLLDLSGMDFTSRYNLSVLNTIQRDGKLFYLPGPAQVRGIIYNKTLFAENNWQLPTDFESFVSLCKTIEASGIRSLQLGFGNAEVLDTAFVGYNYAGFYSKPQDEQWIDNYNAGKGSFGDHFAPALDVFQRMIDEGIWKSADLDITYADREQMLFTRKCAMVEDSVLMARMGYSQTGTTDEFALMPFFNPGDTSDADWARLYMVCFVGLNKHLAEEANKEKYKLALELMDYISTPEGQEMLASDTGAMFSSLTESTPPDIPEIDALLPALNHGRYATFPTLENAQSALRTGLAGMLRGELNRQQVIALVDEQNQNPPQVADPEVLGQASADFTLTDTGNFITDVMRKESGCELSLFLDNGKDGRYNGKGVSGALYQGDLTSADIDRVLPDLKRGEDGTLWKVSMTGENLRQTLEYAISVDNDQTGWYYYFSGLHMEYDPSAEPGSRIRSITLTDGSPLEDSRTYSVAVMDDSVPEEYMLSCDKTDLVIGDLLKEFIRTEKTVSPTKDGRFRIPSAVAK